MLLLLSIGWYFQWFIWCGWSFTCHSLAHSHSGSDYKLCTEKSIYSQTHAGEEGTERERECERRGQQKERKNSTTATEAVVKTELYTVFQCWLWFQCNCIYIFFISALLLVRWRSLICIQHH